VTTGLTVKGLNIRFANGFHPVRNVSFHIEQGETLGVVGESGSGKSLSVLAAMGLLPRGATVEAEELRFDGLDLLRLSEKELRAIRGRRIAMIFQDPMSSLNPAMTIGRQLTEIYTRHLRGTRRAALARAVQMLGQVGISEPERRLGEYPHQLSGGMRQRVMIAAALMCSPELLIADEPTTALDVTIQAEILALLKRLQQELGMGILLITHDMTVVAEMAHRAAVMYAGQIVETSVTRDIFAKPAHPYTRALIDCIPVPGRTAPGSRLATIEGVVPSLKERLVGCHFFGRCHFAHAACDKAPIPMQGPASHRVRCVLDMDVTRALPPAIEADARMPATADSRAPLLTVEGVIKTYRISDGALRPRRVADVLRGVDLDIRRGEILGLVGESGSGKTTLTQIMLGLLPPSSGEVRLDGRPIGTVPRGDRARRLQPVFQDPYGSLNPSKTIASIVGLPLKIHGIGDAADRRTAVLRMLGAVGLAERHADLYPVSLSGGQRQRVAIARALISEPELVVCDEPTSALDVSVQAQILNLLLDLRRTRNLTYVIVSHNLAVIRHVADRIAVIYRGELVELGPAHEVFERPQHAYTRTLLRSTLKIAP
jgi:peptide/nickel transport system ATP-binding protein